MLNLRSFCLGLFIGFLIGFVVGLQHRVIKRYMMYPKSLNSKGFADIYIPDDLQCLSCLRIDTKGRFYIQGKESNNE